MRGVLRPTRRRRGGLGRRRSTRAQLGRATSPRRLPGRRVWAAASGPSGVLDARPHARDAASWTPVRTVLRRRCRRRRRVDGGYVLRRRRSWRDGGGVVVVVDAVGVDDLAILQLNALHLAVQRRYQSSN